MIKRKISWQIAVIFLGVLSLFALLAFLGDLAITGFLYLLLGAFVVIGC